MLLVILTARVAVERYYLTCHRPKPVLRCGRRRQTILSAEERSPSSRLHLTGSMLRSERSYRVQSYRTNYVLWTARPPSPSLEQRTPSYSLSCSRLGFDSSCCGRPGLARATREETLDLTFHSAAIAGERNGQRLDSFLPSAEELLTLHLLLVSETLVLPLLFHLVHALLHELYKGRQRR